MRCELVIPRVLCQRDFRNVAPEVVSLKTSDVNSVKMMTFPFQWAHFIKLSIRTLIQI